MYFQIQVEELSEVDFEGIISNLWASRIWGNKQYLVQKIITENGFSKVKEEIKKILDTFVPAPHRYERAFEQIIGLGPASITEMLSYHIFSHKNVEHGTGKQEKL